MVLKMNPNPFSSAGIPDTSKNYRLIFSGLKKNPFSSV